MKLQMSLESHLATDGDLTAKQNGSVGGYMVKKMIEAQERQMAGKGENIQ